MNNLDFRILSEGLKLAPVHGFSNATYIRVLKKLDIKPNAVADLWPRGFPIALVDYLVKSSTDAVQKELELKYSKNAVLSHAASNVDAFIENQLAFPRPSDVVEDALRTKIDFLVPFVGKWHEGVKHELLPSNIPYTVINLSVFADITSFYIERVQSMEKLLESAKDVLVYKIKANAFESKTNGELEKFLLSFLKGLPLSSGPHVGGFLGQLHWSLMRGKVAALYGVSVASLMGDKSICYSDTYSLVKKSSKTLF